MKKSLVVMITAALVASAFVAPVAEAKKKKKPKACAPYVPGEKGADAELLTITDAATAEAPAVTTISLPQQLDEGIFSDPVPAYVNIQVDPKAAAAGLYATFEFPTRRDYDMYARYPDGSEAASSHGFQPLIEANADTPAGNPSNTSSNHAGESKAASENIVGLTTADCGGYTFEFINYLGEGGDFEIKFWLGEGTTDPRPMGETP